MLFVIYHTTSYVSIIRMNKFESLFLWKSFVYPVTFLFVFFFWIFPVVTFFYSLFFLLISLSILHNFKSCFCAPFRFCKMCLTCDVSRVMVIYVRYICKCFRNGICIVMIDGRVSATVHLSGFNMYKTGIFYPNKGTEENYYDDSYLYHLHRSSSALHHEV